MAQIVAALRYTKGRQALAARHLRCDPKTIWNMIERHPEIGTVIEEANNLRLDVAESKLDAAVKQGQAWAICFFLKTQGKGRGYIERSEHAGPGGGGIPVRLDISRLTDEELATLRSLTAKLEGRA